MSGTNLFNGEIMTEWFRLEPFCNRNKCAKQVYQNSKGYLGVGQAPKSASLGVSEEPKCRVCDSKCVLGTEDLRTIHRELSYYQLSNY